MDTVGFSVASVLSLLATFTRNRGHQQVRAKITAEESAKRVSQRTDLPIVTEDIILRAGKGERTSRVPVWAMRQAGRYLPEFMELRKYDFLERVHTPHLAAEITLQPLRRYVDTLDAVVIFSDILIVPPVMGLPVVFQPGPQFSRLLETPADLATLNFAPNVMKEFKFLFDAIALTRKTAAAPVSEGGVGKAVPVIGFVGAPWTLMSYMIDGELAHSSDSTGKPPKLVSHKTYEKSKTWLIKYPEASHRLLSAITDILIELLVGQYQAGADILQVFETNAEHLSPARFQEFALPYLTRIATEVKARTPSRHGPVLIVYPKGGHHSLQRIAEDTDYDAISIDWSINPAEAVRVVTEAAKNTGKPVKALQGNLDPCELFGDAESIRTATKTMLDGFGKHPLIGNLGHGMLPAHKPEGLGAFFRAVHDLSQCK